MRRIDHPLLSASLGSYKTLTSFHYGPAGVGPKVYVQASLHAEELPGMLVAHHLRSLLQAEEDAGRLVGEIVVVPAANPIGLAQRLDHKPMGRFELGTSENFNRHYPDLAKTIWPDVQAMLGAEPLANVAAVRNAIAGWLGRQTPDTELESLRHTLLALALDADYVLDLHCDCEAVMHLYTEESCWRQIAPLAQYLGTQAVLLAKNSGGGPFDECLSGVWWQLAELLRAGGNTSPLPQGCYSTTVELRGESDVTHALAQADAQALLAFLKHVNAIDGPAPQVPPALCEPTPLAGSETLISASAGVLVFKAEVGQTLRAGDVVAEVIDPIGCTVQPIKAGVAGLLYARIRERYVTAGAEIGKIAGSVAFRTGELLGA